MSFFSSLFRKKPADKKHPFKEEVAERQDPQTTITTLHLKGKPDANGLYPAELVMLSLAESFKITETCFPRFLTSNYEISNPLKMLQDLHSRMFLDIGDAKDCLATFKLTELQEIAATLNVPVKGKKADIVAQFSDVSEEELSVVVKDRTWKLSSQGRDALNANPYIQYFLEKHNYDITEVDVDIWTVNAEFVKNPKQPYRDIIYGQLNKAMNKASIQIQKKPTSGTTITNRYCECYRLMGLFIEEEESYVNACDMYFQYLFKRINIHAGLQLLINYKTYSYDKKFRNGFISQYYEEIQLYPYQKKELLRLIDKCNISSEEIRGFLIKSFERTNDSGVMTANEAADFVILELSGETDKSRELAHKLAKKAVKKI